MNIPSWERTLGGNRCRLSAYLARRLCSWLGSADIFASFCQPEFLESQALLSMGTTTHGLSPKGFSDAQRRLRSQCKDEAFDESVKLAALFSGTPCPIFSEKLVSE
jgi:hypothetical protein